MKNIKDEALIWMHFGGVFIIWLVILFFSNKHFNIDSEALKKIPDAVTTYVIVLFIFTEWAWKLKIFKGWLVPFPNLEGTWEGNFTTTWEGRGNVPQSIPMILVIKQSFNSISCCLYTKESSSYSTTAQINEDDNSGIFRLSYNYTNRPKASIRSRSEIHDGAAILRIVEKPEKSLEGEYWTSRKTTGDVKLKFKSAELLQSFPE